MSRPRAAAANAICYGRRRCYYDPAPPALRLLLLPPPELLLALLYSRLTQGRSDGGIWVFIPPKSAQVNFLWGKNDVRTAIQQFYTPQLLYPLKQISGYAPVLTVSGSDFWTQKRVIN